MSAVEFLSWCMVIMAIAVVVASSGA